MSHEDPIPSCIFWKWLPSGCSRNKLSSRQVHSYVAMPGGKTAYLSELKSGAEVLVTDSEGRQRVATVGRVKIETRPLVQYPPCHHPGDAILVLENKEFQ